MRCAISLNILIVWVVHGIIINDSIMKDLCTKKKYDLSQLNNEQFQAVLDWLKENDTGWEEVDLINFSYRVKGTYLIYPLDGWYWSVSKDDLTNALELFEEEPNCCEIVVNSMGRVEPKYPNYSCDKSIYDDMLSLIEKGKQHGLKIVVTFEKL